MAMAVENRQQLPLGSLTYDQMRYSNGPQFTNPWSSENTQNQSHLYQQQQQQQQPQQQQQQQSPPVSSGLDLKQHSQASRNTPLQQYQMAPTSTAPAVSATSMFAPSAYDHTSLDTSQTMISQPRSYGNDYPTTTQASVFAPTSAPQFTQSYAQNANTYVNYQQDLARRPSYTARAPHAGRDTYSDALDASRGMLAMSQDLTPRNIYGNDNPRQATQDSYGFPTTHSAHSSISSGSTYPSFYNGSVNSSMNGSADGSVTDYSSAGEEGLVSRTLPRPTGFINGSMPPAASSMMSQFNSKVAPSTQKKHKCKICDKRFTRPSSLQTHMYSHTGEKPFACDAEGCGRNFSVVSNLRRHKKVHKGEIEGSTPGDD